TWTNTAANTGVFQMGSGAVLTNSGSFTDALAFNADIGNAFGGAASRFVNTGSYTKTGAGTTSINIGFDNSGALVVNSGQLNLGGGGNSSGGSIAVAAGATLNFSGGTHNLANIGTGAGTGRVTVSGGTVNASGTLDLAGTLGASGGTFNANGAATAAGFEMSNGTIGGTGSLVTSGNGVWTGGTMNGSGSTTLGGTLALSGSSNRAVVGRSVTFSGDTTWTNTAANTGVFQMGSGAALGNSGSFTDALAFNADISNAFGGAASTFTNSGSYTKTGAGTTTVALAATNSGSLSVGAGTLLFTAGLSNYTPASAMPGTLTGGSYTISGDGVLQVNGANITVNAATVVLDGPNAQFRSAAGTSALAGFSTNAAAGRFTVRNGRSFTSAPGAFSNQGVLTVGDASSFTTSGGLSNGAGAQLLLQGGSLLASGGLNNAGSVAGFGSIQAVAVNQAGATILASGGNLAFGGGLNGSAGRMEIASGASVTMTPGLNSTTGVLAHAGTALDLGNGNLTVFSDYDNAAFGTGNAFDRRALVSGTGRILAAGSTQQTITGALVQNGTTASAVLALPNGRVGLGGASASFVVNNVGTGGPALRGALQTTSITDAALSGSGVTAQNWGALAQGGSTAAFTVNYAPTSGGALSGQVLQIVNNFDNVAPQALTITGSAFNLAQASAASPNPVVLAAQRLGATPLMQALLVGNLAAAGSFSERLNGSIAVTAGDALAAGAFNLLAAGGSSSSLQVGLSTAVAGARTGTATLAFASDGTGTSGFAPLAQAAQQVTVQGDVYRLANPVVTTSSITLAARVGSAPPSAAISLRNQSPDAYTERLDAGFIGAAPTGFSYAGQVSGLVAGASSSALGVALNTAAAGSFSGTANLALVSSGAGTTLAPDLALAGAQVGLQGRVYAAAVAAVGSTTVDFGIVRVGDAVAVRGIRIGNTASGALQDTLHASLSGGGSPFAASGSTAGLAGGAVDATSLQVQLGTAAAGQFSGTATLALSSRNPDLADLDLGNRSISLLAQVNNLAVPEFTLAAGAGSFSGSGVRYTLDFGTLAQGSGPVLGSLSLRNVASGPADDLAGSFDLGAAVDALSLNGFGSFAGIAAGDVLAGLQVQFDTASVGHFERTVVLHGISRNGSGPDLLLPTVELQLQGNVAAVPEPSTWLLMAGGALLLARRLRRQRVTA
ncbi:MAG TPA: choice-of-anchor D domain-containing protein, partial [Aquabacterium sp.]|nr:choice-of-anchor D domain-containing protein [Aquabacterium sp.]